MILSVATLFCSAGLAQTSRNTTAITTLVEAERAFARTSLENGARRSFMMFFADDAVVFRPHPVIYKEAMKGVPEPKNPLETTLQWEPLCADVSRGGDLGYTTGPSVWTDNGPGKRPPYYGYYFSVWKKQPSGEWKVVFDIGTGQPGPYSGSRSLCYAPEIHPVKKMKAITAQEQLRSLSRAERDFLVSSKKNGALRALADFQGDEARIYRQKGIPIVGRSSIRKYFSINPYLSDWKPIRSDVAASGDLGYVYGSYTGDSTAENSGVSEKGYYVRMWKRDANNEWKFVSEVTSPLPPETPKAKE